ncbi:hypothetical protein [Hansschlegelia sp.]|uniref:hypothetical protein n=1 Tax=Hansschlegelia sp. TaxID=2041892 RepID=UPI002C3378AC|nr:hypothetical protein [Hansschlegelia sp.]HVI28302.1 hypothetical protein [Hansschlegelia sp.]
MDKLTELGAQAFTGDTRHALNAAFATAVVLLGAGGVVVLTIVAAARLFNG